MNQHSSTEQIEEQRTTKSQLQTKRRKDAIRRHRIVVVGGGFGGLWAVKSLKRADADVILIDRRNHHLFQPLLYQVATGGLSPSDISSPFRIVLKDQKNAQVVMGSVTGVDYDQQEVILEDDRIAYDSLIIATGSEENYFNNPEWQHRMFGLKGLEDAIDFRRQLFSAFEKAEKSNDPHEREKLLTFVIVGGGPTGVEMAGAIGEVTRLSLPRGYKHLSASDVRIELVEFKDRILEAFPEKLSRAATKSLERMGVTVRTGAMVTDVDDDGVVFKVDDARQRITAATVMWAAGVKPTPLGDKLVKDDEDKLDKKKRVKVEPDLSVPGYPNVFVVGDLANFSHQDGHPLPALAAVAMSQGKYLGTFLRRSLKGKSTKPYRYRDKGKLAVIGRAAAVADLPWIKLSGYPAWFIWLFVHLMYLVGFEERILVFTRWAWSYFTRKPGGQLLIDHPEVK